MRLLHREPPVYMNIQAGTQPVVGIQHGSILNVNLGGVTIVHGPSSCQWKSLSAHTFVLTCSYAARRGPLVRQPHSAVNMEPLQVD